jgi:cobalt transporter subunit CbtB
MSDMVGDRGRDLAPAPVVSLGELFPYLVLVGTLMAVLVYFVGAEQGPVHEFVHDARHLLGFPCH